MAALMQSINRIQTEQAADYLIKHGQNAMILNHKSLIFLIFSSLLFPQKLLVEWPNATDTSITIDVLTKGIFGRKSATR